jgi:rhamnopyranosyl-N-acetylglucosaminyl-diphospho-decaprenol beta-1,3/1,4-galactofuranosyltransferase
MSRSVAAVVVTFNRKALLVECIAALLAQTHPLARIYIIDNASSDGTRDLLDKQDFMHDPRITYVGLAENIGGAGGFNHGMGLALADGYEWMWVMDDDAEALPDALEKLVTHIPQGSERPAPLTSEKRHPDGRRLLNYLGFVDWQYRAFECVRPLTPAQFAAAGSTIELEMATFVGLLIPRWLVIRIGLPKADLFIHADDLEYCLRMRDLTRIVLVKDSIVLHKEEITTAFQTVKLLGRASNRIRYERYWISYYGARNHLWLLRRYSDRVGLGLLRCTLFMCRKLLGILIHDDHKLRRSRFVLLQYLDGLQGVFDNDKPRRILYGP